MRQPSFQLAAPLQPADRTYVLDRRRRLSYFGGCDYFRLSSHPQVRAALCEGLDEYGLNVAASRVTTGNHALYERLERRLAVFFGVESALLVATGYMANLAAAEALQGQITQVSVDERSHSSLKTAMRLLGAPSRTFRHRDPRDVRIRSKRVLIATDGMFAQDGELAPLERYLELLPREGLLLVDDSHGAGTLGRSGKGTPEVLRIQSDQIVRTITLSKAFGVYGGAILGSRELCERVVARSGFFIGQTPLPLPLISASMRSLELLRSDRTLRTRLRHNTTFVKSRIRALGFAVPDNESPIVAFVPKTERDIRDFRRALLGQGIFPSWIRYPGGPKHGCFRFALSSEHTRGQLEALVEAFMRLRPTPASRKSRRPADAGR